MKGRHTIVLLSIASALTFWIFDAFLGYLAFRTDTFWNLLSLEIPVRLLYSRSVMMVAILFFGVVVSHAYSQSRIAQEQTEAANLELKRSDQQLREEQAALRAERDRAQKYLDVVGVIILALDREGGVILINRQGCDILGRTEAELLGSNWFETCVKDSTRADARSVFSKLMEGSVSEVEVSEGVIVDRRGHQHIIEWHNTVLRNEHGGVIATLSAGEDITQRREAEEAERSLQDNLARTKRMESLGVLAGQVAHDLNNILMPIVALPDMIVRYVQSLAPDQDMTALKEDLLSISSAGKSAANVIRDLLTLGRRGRYQMAPLILNEVICEYMQTPAFRRCQKDSPAVHVQLELDDELLPISGSESHLSQVIMNLVSNACDAMPTGGTLKIATSNLYMDTRSLRYEPIAEGEYVRLVVADAGIGMEEATLDKIFEPFYTTKKMGRKSGTGLGLAVVYGVVKDHGGYIDVKSSSQTGTKFTLYFPICRSAVDHHSEAQELATGTEKILVIDDVGEQRAVAQRLMSRLGYNVTTASGGRNAVNIMREAKREQLRRGELAASPYDLIMLDMLMEDNFDGLDTYREICEVYPKPKCIVMSGFARTKRADEVLELSAGTFLAKPFTLAKLASTIRSEIDATR
ncbi:MAG: PAS domain-containing sensor histidine kinase [Lentisphaerales bacterium]|nr:MAG: PAS domain-containing sensor histidine kinase [Lentisphaerales bacterium]